MIKQGITTKTANLGHRRIDHDLIRRVLAMKEAGYCDEVRVVRAA